jgi:hypothetical protein
VSGERVERPLRRAVLLLFLIASAGLLAELLLLAHTEGVLQLIPVGLLGVGIVAGVWVMGARSRAAVLTLRWTGVVQLLAGVTGLWLHYRSNVEFELEMAPDARGAGLIWAALTGAIPALAPGAMIQLGLLGVVYAVAHPALSGSPITPSSES